MKLSEVQKMVDQLAEKSGESVCVTIECWSFRASKSQEVRYTMWINPGDFSSFKSLRLLINRIKDLLKEK